MAFPATLDNQISSGQYENVCQAHGPIQGVVVYMSRRKNLEKQIGWPDSVSAVSVSLSHCLFPSLKI